MSTFQLYEKLKRSMTPESAEALANAFDEFSNEIRKTVTQDDFKELKEIVADLGLAQKRTEQRLDSLTQKVEELAEAQKRTEQKVEELAEAQKRTEQKVEELAEAQKRTEQRLDSLTQKVEELAEAQKRTEQRLDSLTQKVEALAEAQKRTEKTMQEGFENVFRRFDVLGSRWGDEAEEAFRQGLLEHVRHLGYTVEHYQGQDPEGFINGTPRSFDLDVLIQNGTTVASEIKSQASAADVTEFARSVTLLERQTGRKVNRKILVAVTIRRLATERARELGVLVSTGFNDLEPPRK